MRPLQRELQLHQKRVVVDAIGDIGRRVDQYTGRGRESRRRRWTPGYAHRALQTWMHKRATHRDADEQARRGRRREPARSHSAAASDGMTADLSGEADDPRRTARVLEPPENVILLLSKPIGSEHRIGFRVCPGTDVVQKRDELRVARVARLAIGEVLDRGRIERLAATVGEVTLDETVVV